MKDFVEDYILSQITPTQKNNEINILNQAEETSENFGYSYVQCGEHIVFYENATLGDGMNFYIYDKNMNLLKTENLTDNLITIVGNTLKQDENGNFYLLGYMNPEETSQGTIYYSLILLNNIITNTPIIRKWYKLSDLNITYARDCQKRVGSADYLFIYEDQRTQSEWITYDLHLIEFTIDVQNGNTTKKWVYENYSTTRFANIASIGYQYNQETSQILVTRKSDSGLRAVLINLNDINSLLDTTNILSIGNGVVLNKFLTLGVANLIQNDRVIVNGISNIVFIKENSNEIVQYNNIDEFTNPIVKTIGENINGYFLFNRNYVGYITGSEGDYTITLHRYELTESEIILSEEVLLFNNTYGYDISQYLLNLVLINTQVYNLNYISLIMVGIADSGIATIIKTDNSLMEYRNYNSLVPSYINIWSDNDIIFSRKLTNESIVGNQMSAEINIPYSMLNQTFSVEKLISETYKTLAYKNKIINKNIYESLYLNFINHINVIDNNYNKNELQNNISALLTKSIFSTPQADYDVSPIGYIKVFTTTGEELIFSIGNDSIEQIRENEYLISIAVNGNNAEKIQIMAKDKITPYVTIPLYSINKIIIIKQKIIFNDTSS